MTEQEAFEEWAIANWPFAADEDAASIWHAALAWLRSQVVPIATLHDDGYWTWKNRANAPHESNYAGWRMDVFAAPQSAIENDDREYLSAIAHLGRAMKRLAIAARTSGGTAGPDTELMAACAQAEDAMSVGAIGRAMEAPQPAIPVGWQLVPKEPTPEMVKAGNIGQGFSKDALKAAIAAAPKPGESS